MGLIILGIGSIDYLSLVDFGGLRVVGDFCSCVVMYVYSGMICCWWIILVVNSWQLMSIFVFLVFVGVVGGFRVEYCFLCGGMVFCNSLLNNKI